MPLTTSRTPTHRTKQAFQMQLIGPEDGVASIILLCLLFRMVRPRAANPTRSVVLGLERKRSRQVPRAKATLSV
jgi:hypothetical protein